MSTDAFITGRLPLFDPATRPHGVLVGFDGSENAKAALDYAAEAAQLRKTRLTVVTAYRLPRHFYPNYASLPKGDEDEQRNQRAKEILAAARTHLENYSGDVQFLLAQGHATEVFRDMSAEAQLTVVGSRGRGGFMGLLVGSVATALPPRAGSPVVVVPTDVPEAGSDDGGAALNRPVVAGVDGSAASRAVELQAAQAAQERGVVLQILMVMPPPDSLASWYPELVQQSVIDSRRSEYEDWLDAERRWLQGHFPDLKISRHLAYGDPVTTFVDSSNSAQLIVVGTRGRGAVAGTVLGSVSRELLQQQVGSVMVVPELRDPRTEA